VAMSEDQKATNSTTLYAPERGGIHPYDAAYRAAMEEAARICEEQQQTFLSPEYAVNQPMSSFAERFACGQCAKAIRAAAGLPDPHGESACVIERS
jgi:hypothetical protein